MPAEQKLYQVNLTIKMGGGEDVDKPVERTVKVVAEDEEEASAHAIEFIQEQEKEQDSGFEGTIEVNKVLYAEQVIV